MSVNLDFKRTFQYFQVLYSFKLGSVYGSAAQAHEQIRSLVGHTPYEHSYSVTRASNLVSKLTQLWGVAP
jgi:hypothetical protein